MFMLSFSFEWKPICIGFKKKLFVYIGISVGGLIIKRGGLGSHQPS